MIGGFDTTHLQTLYVDEGTGVPRKYTGKVVAVQTDDNGQPHALCLRTGGELSVVREVWYNYARVIRWHLAGAG